MDPKKPRKKALVLSRKNGAARKKKNVVQVDSEASSVSRTHLPPVDVTVASSSAQLDSLVSSDQLKRLQDRVEALEKEVDERKKDISFLNSFLNVSKQQENKDIIIVADAEALFEYLPMFESLIHSTVDDKNIMLALPFTVVEQVYEKRDDPNEDVSQKARLALLFINNNMNNPCFLFQTVLQEALSKTPVSSEVNNDKILEHCHYMRTKEGKNVFLLAEDTCLNIKAYCWDIATLDIKRMSRCLTAPRNISESEFNSLKLFGRV